MASGKSSMTLIPGVEWSPDPAVIVVPPPSGPDPSQGTSTQPLALVESVKEAIDDAMAARMPSLIKKAMTETSKPNQRVSPSSHALLV